MRTLHLAAADPGDLARAAAILRRGGLVAFPTETVYGLGADGLDGGAVRRIFAAKGRPADNPLILHLAGPDMLPEVAVEVPPLARRLAELFWPGPLTLVLARGPAVPAEAAGGLDSVAVRVPAHPAALALITRLGRPVAAPSANRSGRPSPTRAEDVLEDLDGRIDAVLDGGATRLGVESTVVDVRQSPPRLLRPGGLAVEEVEAVAGPLSSGAAGGPARSPGLRYRHYAPRARVVVAGAGAAAVRQAIGVADPAGLLRVGALLTDETAAALAGAAAAAGWAVRRLGGRRDPAAQARRLFAALHDLDRLGVGLIVAESVPDAGLGRAVMDRIRRAADGSDAGAAASGGGTVRGCGPRPPAGPGGRAIVPRPAAWQIGTMSGTTAGGRRRGGGEAGGVPASVLFVCTGNTCRSPLAEALARRDWIGRGLAVEVSSAGLAALDGMPAAEESGRAAALRGADLSAHRSRRLSEDAVERAALILTMTTEQASEVRRRFPRAAGRVADLLGAAGLPGRERGVPDPVGQDAATYEATARRLEEAVAALGEGWTRASGWAAGDGPVPPAPDLVALGSDHAGYPLKEAVRAWLGEWGLGCLDLGTDSEASTDYPDYAAAVGRAVASGEVRRGILVCGSGIGMSIAANKVPGVRAAVCRDIYDGRICRQDNDANVLCLGGRVTGAGLAREIVRAWLETPFSGGRHVRRIEKIGHLERPAADRPAGPGAGQG